MTKFEKERRNIIKNQIKKQEKAQNLESLPISANKLAELFDYLDDHLSRSGCNNDLNFTNIFICQNNLPKSELIQWLGNNGGYCDCEVLANVENEINDK